MNRSTNSRNTEPLVSIVTPSLNQARYLEETIRSVLAQEYPLIEFIVIDGGSTDGSLQILERYDAEISYWTSQPDSGQTDAINKGFNMAKGEILTWLNSDDLLRPSAVREAVTFLGQSPEVGMVYGDADYINETGQILGRFPAAQTDYRRLKRGYVHIPQQAAFFRSSVWRMVGPLDPSFYFAMDYDLWVRIAGVSPIQYIPRPWAAFRLHDSAKTTAAVDRCWPEMVRVHKRDGGKQISMLTLKYVLRRILEPWMPYRLKLRLWAQSMKVRWNRNR